MIEGNRGEEEEEGRRRVREGKENWREKGERMEEGKAEGIRKEEEWR